MMNNRIETGNLDYRFGFAEALGEADGAIGGVVVAEAPAAGKTGAPGAGTAGAFGLIGATEADG